MTQSIVAGTCLASFSRVKAEFEKNFSQREELGASVCVILRGETVVDLWGGTSNSPATVDWTSDTITRVFSCTKGAVALCAHMLADSGDLDLHAPVSRYWPEFQKNGPKEIPVRLLLNHQLGLPALRGNISERVLYDPHALADLLAVEPLFWEPGTQHGYHALTFGALVGEVIFRITGMTVGQYFRKEIAKPLDLDFWIGLPDEHDDRVSPTVMPPESAAENPIKATENNEIAEYARANLGAFLSTLNQRESRAAEIPAGGGIGNARGLARMYAPLSLDGSFEGTRLLRPEALPRMAYPSSVCEKDRTLGIPTCFTLGFTKSWGTGDSSGNRGFAIGTNAFGHPGMGGSIGFADPSSQFSFAYTMNRINSDPSLDDRARSLIDEVYKALNYAGRDSGVWS